MHALAHSITRVLIPAPRGACRAHSCSEDWGILEGFCKSWARPENPCWGQEIRSTCGFGSSALFWGNSLGSALAASLLWTYQMSGAECWCPQTYCSGFKHQLRTQTLPLVLKGLLHLIHCSSLPNIMSFLLAPGLRTSSRNLHLFWA